MGASTKIGGLTKKQRIFVREYVKHENGVKAVEKAYPNAQPTVKRRSSMSSQLLNRPNVRSAIIKALDKAGLNDDFVADTLKKNIEPGVGNKATAASVNRSLELLIKLRQPVRESKTSNLHLHMLKDMDNMTNPELIEKRQKLNHYFNELMNKQPK